MSLSRGAEGIEEDGLEVHSSMYKGLIANGPKEFTEHPRFQMSEFVPEDEHKQCFHGIDFYMDYMIKLKEKFDLEKYIQYKSWVERVAFDKSRNMFLVQVRNLRTHKVGKMLQFDYVIVASGHFNYPNVVEYPGQETFPGKVLHSKYFMDASRYAGQSQV